MVRVLVGRTESHQYKQGICTCDTCVVKTLKSHQSGWAPSRRLEFVEASLHSQHELCRILSPAQTGAQAAPGATGAPTCHAPSFVRRMLLG